MAKPTSPQTVPRISALVSPSAFTIGPMSPPCTIIEPTPTAASVRPTSFVAPTESIGGIKHEGRGQHDVREIAEELDGRIAHQARAAQEPHGADGIGGLELEGAAFLRRQRLRQYEQTVEKIRKAQACRDPEGKPGILIAKQPAECRPEHEADAKGRADHAEGLGAFVGLRYIGDVGEGARKACRGDA